MATRMATCRFCKELVSDSEAVKYGLRHYAHAACYLDAGKPLSDLTPWQVSRLPYRALKQRGLLAEAESITRNVECV